MNRLYMSLTWCFGCLAVALLVVVALVWPAVVLADGGDDPSQPCCGMDNTRCLSLPAFPCLDGKSWPNDCKKCNECCITTP
jgi:hypothetical protein